MFANLRKSSHSLVSQPGRFTPTVSTQDDEIVPRFDKISLSVHKPSKVPQPPPSYEMSSLEIPSSYSQQNTLESGYVDGSWDRQLSADYCQDGASFTPHNDFSGATYRIDRSLDGKSRDNTPYDSDSHHSTCEMSPDIICSADVITKSTESLKSCSSVKIDSSISLSRSSLHSSSAGSVLLQSIDTLTRCLHTHYINLVREVSAAHTHSYWSSPLSATQVLSEYSVPLRISSPLPSASCALTTSEHISINQLLVCLPLGARVSVVGERGVGKTTLLVKLLHDWITLKKPSYLSRFQFVFYLPLWQFALRGYKSIVDFISSELIGRNRMRLGGGTSTSGNVSGAAGCYRLWTYILSSANTLVLVDDYQHLSACTDHLRNEIHSLVSGSSGLKLNVLVALSPASLSLTPPTQLSRVLQLHIEPSWRHYVDMYRAYTQTLSEHVVAILSGSPRLAQLCTRAAFCFLLCRCVSHGDPEKLADMSSQPTEAHVLLNVLRTMFEFSISIDRGRHNLITNLYSRVFQQYTARSQSCHTDTQRYEERADGELLRCGLLTPLLSVGFCKWRRNAKLLCKLSVPGLDTFLACMHVARVPAALDTLVKQCLPPDGVTTVADTGEAGAGGTGQLPACRLGDVLELLLANTLDSARLVQIFSALRVLVWSPRRMFAYWHVLTRAGSHQPPLEVSRSWAQCVSLGGDSLALMTDLLSAHDIECWQNIVTASVHHLCTEAELVFRNNRPVCEQLYRHLVPALVTHVRKLRLNAVGCTPRHTLSACLHSVLRACVSVKSRLRVLHVTSRDLESSDTRSRAEVSACVVEALCQHLGSVSAHLGIHLVLDVDMTEEAWRGVCHALAQARGVSHLELVHFSASASVIATLSSLLAVRSFVSLTLTCMWLGAADGVSVDTPREAEGASELPACVFEPGCTHQVDRDVLCELSSYHTASSSLCPLFSALRQSASLHPSITCHLSQLSLVRCFSFTYSDSLTLARSVISGKCRLTALCVTDLASVQHTLPLFLALTSVSQLHSLDLSSSYVHAHDSHTALIARVLSQNTSITHVNLSRWKLHLSSVDTLCTLQRLLPLAPVVSYVLDSVTLQLPASCDLAAHRCVCARVTSLSVNHSVCVTSGSTHTVTQRLGDIAAMCPQLVTLRASFTASECVCVTVLVRCLRAVVEMRKLTNLTLDNLHLKNYNSRLDDRLRSLLKQLSVNRIQIRNLNVVDDRNRPCNHSFLCLTLSSLRHLQEIDVSGLSRMTLEQAEGVARALRDMVTSRTPTVSMYLSDTSRACFHGMRAVLEAAPSLVCVCTRNTLRAARGGSSSQTCRTPLLSRRRSRSSTNLLASARRELG